MTPTEAPSIGNESGACQLGKTAEVYNRLLACLLPERCANCGAVPARGLCQPCRSGLRPVPTPCRGCGLAQPVARCPREGARWSVSSVVAPLRYESPLDGYIHALKFLSHRRMGRALGLVLAEILRAEEILGAVSALIPVPLHAERLRQRGFNQAYEIARPIAATMNLTLVTSGVKRSVPTQAQTLVDAYRRSTNVEYAFRAHGRFEGATIAIIDDVITTGATINSLARDLRRAGAADVHAWCLARVEPSLGSEEIVQHDADKDAHPHGSVVSEREEATHRIAIPD